MILLFQERADMVYTRTSGSMVVVICVKSWECVVALELEDGGVAMLVRVPMASMVDVVDEVIKV